MFISVSTYIIAAQALHSCQCVYPSLRSRPKGPGHVSLPHHHTRHTNTTMRQHTTIYERRCGPEVAMTPISRGGLRQP